MKKAYIKRNEASGFDVSVADWFFLRLRGLIGRNPEEFGPLLIIPCSDIHTFFMSAAIDVIYVNKTAQYLRLTLRLPRARFVRRLKDANM